MAVRFRLRIFGSIGREQRCHGCGVFANLFNRTREPLLDRSIHQPVGEEKHHDDWHRREEQRADNHAGAKLRANHAQTPFDEELEQIARENERQRDEQQKNENGQRRKKQELAVAVWRNEFEIERGL